MSIDNTRTAPPPQLSVNLQNTDAPRAEAKTQADEALHLIYNDIVSGRYAPGMRLKLDDLKKNYDLGVNPIREALLRLTAEGLVRVEGQRGFRVPAATIAELLDIACTRARLSCISLQESIALGDDAWEGKVVAAFHQLERIYPLMLKQSRDYAQEWEHRNRQFHWALESACGSPWTLHFSAIAFAQSERYRRHFVDYIDLFPTAQEEHRLIMEAAINRRAEEACDYLKRHIMENMQVVMKHMTAKSPENRISGQNKKSSE